MDEAWGCLSPSRLIRPSRLLILVLVLVRLQIFFCQLSGSAARRELVGWRRMFFFFCKNGKIRLIQQSFLRKNLRIFFIPYSPIYFSFDSKSHLWWIYFRSAATDWKLWWKWFGDRGVGSVGRRGALSGFVEALSLSLPVFSSFPLPSFSHKISQFTLGRPREK